MISTSTTLMGSLELPRALLVLSIELRDPTEAVDEDFIVELNTEIQASLADLRLQIEEIREG